MASGSSGSSASPFVARFASGRYLLLTTFRRNGTPVATPVWFAVDDAHLLVYTSATTGKAKRLRHTSRVRVAPCTSRGRPTGEEVAAVARFLPQTEAAHVDRRLNEKYGILAFGRSIFLAAMALWC